jgi:hypothetical protein
MNTPELIVFLEEEVQKARNEQDKIDAMPDKGQMEEHVWMRLQGRIEAWLQTLAYLEHLQTNGGFVPKD